MELTMTFKKINKRGQAIFEYFILTAVAVMAVLFFSQSKAFQDIKTACSDKFNQAVGDILN